ncbi:hypothetical protein [Microcoleus sp. AR_TQ3_B6]|uniref:hypothetical protein n=1 Tax=Microcoleus sp. AR_TQ3_B6 TaxID=3055284 RepID=UPI002FD624F8
MPPIPRVTVNSGYKPQSIDTSIEAEVLMFQLLQQLTPTKSTANLRFQSSGPKAGHIRNREPVFQSYQGKSSAKIY